MSSRKRNSRGKEKWIDFENWTKTKKHIFFNRWIPNSQWMRIIYCYLLKWIRFLLFAYFFVPLFPFQPIRCWFFWCLCYLIVRMRWPLLLSSSSSYCIQPLLSLIFCLASLWTFDKFQFHHVHSFIWIFVFGFLFYFVYCSFLCVNANILLLFCLNECEERMTATRMVKTKTRQQ